MTMRILIGVVIGVFVASQSPDTAETIRESTLSLLTQIKGYF